MQQQHLRWKRKKVTLIKRVKLMREFKEGPERCALLKFETGELEKYGQILA